MTLRVPPDIPQLLFDRLPVIERCLETPLIVPFVDPIDVLKCDSRGKEFTNSDHNVTLRVPPGAIPEGLTVHIETGVTLHGPFQFPPGTRPISPIVWFCMQEGVPLLKPVEVILPHFLHNWKGLQLGFLKADHSTFTTAEKRYMFQKLNDPTKFYSEDGKGFGLLSTKHFCFLCIAANITRGQLHERARYSLSPMLPAGWPDAQIARLYFCVTYDLQTCFKTVEQQCPREYGCKNSKQFTFGELEPKLQIEFDEPQAGWVACMAPESNKVIKASEVEFWDKNLEELQLMEKLRMYPPRFTTQVCGSSATGSSQLRVRFKGSCEDLSTEIQLPSIVSYRPEMAMAAAAGGRRPLKPDVRRHDGTNLDDCPTEMELQELDIPGRILSECTFRQWRLFCKHLGDYHHYHYYHHYHHYHHHLHYDHHRYHPCFDCEMILEDWLHTLSPVTWRTLIQALNHARLTDLADNIAASFGGDGQEISPIQESGYKDTQLP